MSRSSRLFSHATKRRPPIPSPTINPCSPPASTSSSSSRRFRRHLVRSILNTLKTQNTRLTLCHQTLDTLFTPLSDGYADDECDSTFPIAFSRIHNPDSALALYGWVRHRLHPPRHLDSSSYSSLLTLLSRYHRFDEIGLVLDDMRLEDEDPTFETCTALITAYSHAGLVDKALEIFYSSATKLPDSDRGGGFGVGVSSIDSLLYALVKNGRFGVAREVYDEMLQRGGGNGVVSNHSTCVIVGGLCEEGKMEDARTLIEERWGKGCVPNVVFYNVLIDGYCKNGDLHKAYAMFQRLKLKGFLPTLITYSVLILGFCKTGDFAKMNKLLKEMQARGLEPNIKIYNGILDARFKCGSVVQAKAVLRRMIASGCEFDIVTYNILITGYCGVDKISQAENLFNYAIRKGFVPNELSYTPLIQNYCRKGDMLTSSALLIEMVERGLSPDLITYGALIHGLVASGDLKEAMAVKNRLMERRVTPDAAIYNVLINGLCKKGMLPTARALLSEMFDCKVLPNRFVYTTLIDGFVRNGDLGEARKVFDFLEQRNLTADVVVYNAMIKGFCRFGLMNDAMRCGLKMRRNGVCLDEFTYTTIIDGHVKQSDMDSALGMVSDMLKRRCKLNVVTYSALINGFCAQGEFARAERAMTVMRSHGGAQNPNVVTYSILIGGFCKYGKIHKAVFYFEEMLRNKCYPNGVTFHYLINGLRNGASESNESIILDVFRNMGNDWDGRTSAYTAIIACLCKHKMLRMGLDLKESMVLKGYTVGPVVFLSLLHGVCLEGRCLDGEDGDWKNILECKSFGSCEISTALRYTALLDRHFNRGMPSRASRIFLSLIENCKFEQDLSTTQETVTA